MKLNIHYNFKVYTADGKLKREMQTPGHSFVRGFLEILYCQMALATFPVRATDGLLKSVVGPDVDILDITSSGNDRGIVVGTGGTTAVQISDYQLEAVVADGSGSGELDHAAQTYVDPTTTVDTAQFSILRDFGNNSGGTIIIGEVGLLGNGSTPANDFLFVRETLPAFLTVLDTETISVLAVIVIASEGDNLVAGGDLFIKTADETVNNSDTLQDDDHLSFSLAANEHVLVEVHFIHTSTSVADLKIGMTVPAGCSVLWNESTGLGAPLTESQTLDVDDFNATVDIGTNLTFTVLNGATAGTFQLQWAQQTAEATNTVLQEGSCMIVHRQ